MELILNYNNEKLPYTLTLKKIKNIHFKIDKDKGILVNANKNLSIEYIKHIVNNKAKWIYKSFNSIKTSNVINVKNETIPFIGKSTKHDFKTTKELNSYYLRESKKILPEIIEKYSLMTNLKYSKVHYRKAKRRWGSCIADRLNFNSYLTIFPIDCIEYVVLHEIAHLKHKNHSKAFYNFIEKYMDNYRDRIKKIKELNYQII